MSSTQKYSGTASCKIPLEKSGSAGSGADSDSSDNEDGDGKVTNGNTIEKVSDTKVFWDSYPVEQTQFRPAQSQDKKMKEAQVGSGKQGKGRNSMFNGKGKQPIQLPD